MFVALAVLFPALLLLGVLGLERVERPLDQRGIRVPVTETGPGATLASTTEGGTHVTGT